MKQIVSLALLALLVVSCRYEPPKPDQQPTPDQQQKAEEPRVDAAAHASEVTAWQKRRAERLQAEDGWLSLIGLHWINEGENEITIDSKSLTAPVKLVRNGSTITLVPNAPMSIDGKPVTAPVTLLDDTNPNGPTVVQSGTVRFQVIKRGDRYGLRVKDSQSETRTKFAGLQYYPIDSKYRVVARFEPYKPMKKIPIVDVLGMTNDSDSPGALVFTLDGKEYRLDPILEEGTDDLFIIFRDATSRDTTYPAGRYLYASQPGPDGTTVVDFNKAYNPPCAFTHFATCPLPPLQNRLPIRIEAGEKKYEGTH